jgi:hypothetical protein
LPSGVLLLSGERNFISLQLKLQRRDVCDIGSRENRARGRISGKLCDEIQVHPAAASKFLLPDWPTMPDARQPLSWLAQTIDRPQSETVFAPTNGDTINLLLAATVANLRLWLRAASACLHEILASQFVARRGAQPQYALSLEAVF